jgi:hypothetical protein
MPEHLPKLQIVAGRNPQLQCVNDKVARLVAMKPWGDIYAALALAASLANDAIEAAQELQQLPGTNGRALQPSLEFWYRVRDCNHRAALAVAGGNQTLAEALITLRFLQHAREEVPDGS